MTASGTFTAVVAAVVIMALAAEATLVFTVGRYYGLW